MSFFTSGDGARFAAFKDELFRERFGSLPRRLPIEQWVRLAEAAGECREYALELAPLEGDEAVPGVDAARLIAEACLQDCAAERWQGAFCYGDMSGVFESLELRDLTEDGRAAWSLLCSVLTPVVDQQPWWVTASFDSYCPYALLDPPRIETIAGALTRTGVAERACEELARQGHYAADDLKSLSAFFQSAASRGDWVLGVEWR